MNVLTKPTLLKAIAVFPEAESSLKRWYKLASNAKWRSFEDIKSAFGSVDRVGDFYIFNINGNHYRLVAKIVFVIDKADGTTSTGMVFIRSVLTHKQYDDPSNWEKGVIG